MPYMPPSLHAHAKPKPLFYLASFSFTLLALFGKQNSHISLPLSPSSSGAAIQCSQPTLQTAPDTGKGS